ncbi:uncharacterized protein LOC131094147 isoform X2 [Melospiza georgiana]|uniref:uncharacterized protein LOC131094147 isoform X2 n=1 Tax=Melospiza georgiana TaxID=44398 RepID=UPI0025AC25FA|nr:uncharacterized protein LOC131094147 isoform X2 [Melospiza georgiana]
MSNSAFFGRGSLLLEPCWNSLLPPWGRCHLQCPLLSPRCLRRPNRRGRFQLGSGTDRLAPLPNLVRFCRFWGCREPLFGRCVLWVARGGGSGSATLPQPGLEVTIATGAGAQGFTFHCRDTKLHKVPPKILPKIHQILPKIHQTLPKILPCPIPSTPVGPSLDPAGAGRSSQPGSSSRGAAGAQIPQIPQIPWEDSGLQQQQEGGKWGISQVGNGEFSWLEMGNFPGLEMGNFPGLEMGNFPGWKWRIFWWKMGNFLVGNREFSWWEMRNFPGWKWGMSLVGNGNFPAWKFPWWEMRNFRGGK